MTNNGTQKKRFGILIKEKRRKLNLTQAQLSRKSGIGVTTISNIESGVKSPIKGQVRAICGALDFENIEELESIYSKDKYVVNWGS